MPKQTILIVEDEAEIREGIRILLSGENYSILEAENVEQALRQMSDQIDLVILDVMHLRPAGLRGDSQNLHRPHSVFNRQGPGIGQADRPYRRRGRLFGKALFLSRADRPGKGPFAALLHLSGQGAARRHLRG